MRKSVFGRSDDGQFIAPCSGRRFKMKVTLDFIIAMPGARTSLWNATPKRRRLGPERWLFGRNRLAAPGASNSRGPNRRAVDGAPSGGVFA